MKAPINNASKTTVIKIDKITSEILRIWKDNPSEYVAAKKLLHEADMILYTDSKKAYSILVKAKKSMMSEAEIAFQYNKIRDAIIQCDDQKTKDLNKKYLDALKKEDYSGAREYLEKLQKTEAAGIAAPGLEIKLASDLGSKAIYDIRNSTDHDITVSSMVFNSGTDRLQCDVGYPFVIHKCAVQRVTVEYKDGTEEVRGHIEYKDGGISKQVNVVACVSSDGGDQ